MAEMWTYSPPATAEVRLLDRRTLLPASPTPRHPLFLSCLDILWRDIHYNRRLLFYARRPPSALQELQRSLSRCLVHYYPWCGRLAQSVNPPHRLFIDCNDAGVEFVEASIDLPLSLLAADGFQIKPFFDQLCQRPDHRGDCLFSSPLLSIQVTVFSDGGLAFGVAHSHVVADGQSLWNFMISWGECSRGVPLSLPPLHDRQRLALHDLSSEKAASWSFFLQSKEDGDRVDSSAVHDGKMCPYMNTSRDASDTVEPKISSVGPERSMNGDLKSTVAPGGNQRTDMETDSNVALGGEADPLVQFAFHVSASDLRKLKTEVGEGFSSYELICTHFWQRTTVARQTPKQNFTNFTVLANLRNHVMPPLPPAYFGNAISLATLFSTADKVGNDALRTTASCIHDLVVKVQHDIANYMHYLETQSTSILDILCSIRRGIKGHNVSSSPRLPVYRVDFGWGKPMAVRPAKIVGEGEIVFFGGGRGDVEICTALPASVMKRLVEDPMFLPKLPSSSHTSDAMHSRL